MHYARTTAGFRNAGELGLQIAKNITEISGIDFKVAWQQQEAMFSYEGVVQALENAPQGLVVRDAGGGSLQMTTLDGINEHTCIGSGFASRSIIPF